MDQPFTTPMDRRSMLKWVAAASAASAAIPHVQGVTPDAPAPRKYTDWDPDLLNGKADWEFVLLASELVTVAALCDVIIPADDHSPAASKVGVPDFINEWVSAPYPNQQRDHDLIRGGLVWINTEAEKRFGKRFDELNDAQHAAICDDICSVEKALPEFKTAAIFFDRFRDLTTGGFYTTPAGFKDLQYMGNVALASFDGPPPEVLKHLGLI